MFAILHVEFPQGTLLDKELPHIDAVKKKPGENSFSSSRYSSSSPIHNTLSNQFHYRLPFLLRGIVNLDEGPSKRFWFLWRPPSSIPRHSLADYLFSLPLLRYLPADQLSPPSWPIAPPPWGDFHAVYTLRRSRREVNAKRGRKISVTPRSSERRALT